MHFNAAPKNAQAFTFSKQEAPKPFYERFMGEPHRIFFSLGLINALVFMAVLLLNYVSDISILLSLLEYHFFSMSFLVFTPFFLGFLFTTFPKFLALMPLQRKEYQSSFYLFAVASLCLLFALFIHPSFVLLAVFSSMFAHLLAFKTLLFCYKRSTLAQKLEPLKILVAFSFGVVVHVLWFLYHALGVFAYRYYVPLQSFSFEAGFFLYLILLTFVIAQRMVPFFTMAMVPGVMMKKSPWLLNIVFALFMLKVFFTLFDSALLDAVINLTLGSVFTYEFYRWRLPLLRAPAMLWVIYMALLWLPLAFFMASIEAFSSFLYEEVVLFAYSSVHMFALGFLTTMLIGFGSRVILGHSGQDIHADKLTIFLFYFTQLVVLSRLIASFNILSEQYSFLLSLSAVLWLVLFLLWAKRYLKTLLS